MPALIAFVRFGFKNHFFVAFGTDHAGPSAHITALKAVVEPAVLIDIEEYVTPAAGATFGFPFRHLYYSIF
jgi:hypothetical protein